MNRIAAIDIGTNSAKVTIADISGEGKLSVVREESEITRLGKGVDATHRLADDAMARTLDAIARFADIAKAAGAVRLVAAGTSALRDAQNGDDFLKQVKDKLDLEIEIVTGDREAGLAYNGVLSEPWLSTGGRPLFVFDIGGGSTELILGGGDKVDRFASLDIGAVRLTERILHSDPPSDGEVREAGETIDKLLQDFPKPAITPVVVGVGGTVVNIAAVHLQSTEPGAEREDGQVLGLSDVESTFDRLRAMPLEQRRTVPGLDPKRADVIVAGALILLRVMRYLNAGEFQVSTRGVRHGLLVEAAIKG